MSRGPRHSRSRTRGEAQRRALAFTAVAAAAVAAAHEWLGVGGAAVATAIGGPISGVAVLAAALACVSRALSCEEQRGAWTLVALAALSWAAGQVYWAVTVADDPSAPFPSLADAGYVGFYLLGTVGLSLLVRVRGRDVNWRLWLDGLIAALGTAAVGAALVFNFVADQASDGGLAKLVTIAYPLGDIFMLSLVIGVYALSEWHPGRTWALFLVGLTAMLSADIASTLQSGMATPPAGDWIIPILLISAACLAAAAAEPPISGPPASGERLDSWRELMTPALFAAVMIGLLTMQLLAPDDWLSIALWAMTMSAVIVRLAVSVRENRRLLEEVRTDSLTGLGNRGRLELDLRRHLTAGREAAPATIVLFDLNGFKQYNDSFGHPAGDRLLQQLGAGLAAATASRGTAYRIGGDEFCALVTCPPERAEETIEAAANALCAEGDGFRVGVSWGAALIPREADEPAAALQLADIRMYAQKEHHRAGVIGRREHPSQPTREEPWEQAADSIGARQTSRREGSPSAKAGTASPSSSFTAT